MRVIEMVCKCVCGDHHFAKTGPAGMVIKFLCECSIRRGYREMRDDVMMIIADEIAHILYSEGQTTFFGWR